MTEFLGYEAAAIFISSHYRKNRDLDQPTDIITAHEVEWPLVRVLVHRAAAKIAYERLHPETAHGKYDRKKAKRYRRTSFLDWAADATKLDKETIKKSVAIGERICSTAYGLLVKTNLGAVNKARLEKFSHLHPREQIEIAQMAASSDELINKRAVSELEKRYAELKRPEPAWKKKLAEEFPLPHPHEEMTDVELAHYFGEVQKAKANLRWDECTHCHGRGFWRYFADGTPEACVIPGCKEHPFQPDELLNGAITMTVDED